MLKRILLGAVVGGVVVFIWGSISHMALGLGGTGIKSLPNEEAVVSAMRSSIRESGFYFFPFYEESPGMTKEQKEAVQKQWGEKIKAGPNGILIYHPQGQEPLSPKQLGTEFLSNVAAALVAAFVLSKAAGSTSSLPARALLVGLLGLFASLDINISYWNWYGFPGSYTLAATLDAFIGWGLAGLAMAGIVKTPATSAAG